MKPTVVIHTNDKQMLGALVSAHSFRRNSRTPGAFDVRIVNANEFPELQEQGHSLLRGGHVRAWDPDDLQSFTPVRFAIPGLLGYESLAVVTDPDVFAVGDVAELFTAISKARRSGAGRGQAIRRSPIRSRPRSCCSTTASSSIGVLTKTLRLCGTIGRLSRLDQP